MQLVIGNKNYSSWSMRPWVLMRQLGLPFDEVKLRFDFEPGARLWTEHGDALAEQDFLAFEEPYRSSR